MREGEGGGTSRKYPSSIALLPGGRRLWKIGAAGNAVWGRNVPKRNGGSTFINSRTRSSRPETSRYIKKRLQERGRSHNRAPEGATKTRRREEEKESDRGWSQLLFRERFQKVPEVVCGREVRDEGGGNDFGGKKLGSLVCQSRSTQLRRIDFKHEARRIQRSRENRTPL